MEHWDIECCKCGKYILTEQREAIGADIKCVKGSYEDGYYDAIKDEFYCKECAEKIEFKLGDIVYHKNLRLVGTFIGYAWESDEEADVEFKMEDGCIEQRHVSVNQLEKQPSNKEIGEILRRYNNGRIKIKN